MHVMYIVCICICVCSFKCGCDVMCVSSPLEVQVSLSPPATSRVCHTFRQWRTPWILIQALLASAVCVFLSVHLYASASNECGQGRQGVLCGEVWCDGVCWDCSEYVCIWVLLCALGRHYNCVCVCVHGSSMDACEVNQYWQWIISSDRVAGGFNGADLTHKHEEKFSLSPLVCYYSQIILFLTRIPVSHYTQCSGIISWDLTTRIV